MTVSNSAVTGAVRARRRAFCSGFGHLAQVRTWIPRPEGLVVRDRVVVANRRGRCVARLNFGPRCRLEMGERGEVLVLLDGRVPCVRICWRSSGPAAVSRVPSRYAAVYGESTPSEALEWSLLREGRGSQIEVRFELL